MKIITFETNNAQEIDEQCNLFEEEHNVKATQSHVYVVNGIVRYSYVLFYIPEKKKEDDDNIQVQSGTI